MHHPADVKLHGWSSTQVQRAVQSLLKFCGQKATTAGLLDDEDQLLYLQLALKKMPMQSRKDKPVPLPLPHPLYSPEGAEICLFVKDHDGQGHKDAKKRLAAFEKKGGISKVVGISKLRTKYESHEAKRQLCKLYDLFLADERVLPSLPKLIGKSFFKAKKQPIPITLTVKDFPAQVKKACSATYLFKGSGTCVNLRVARSSQGADAIAENILATLCQAVQHIPKGWANLQGVFLKTADSVALPLYQALPDAPSRISTAVRPAEEVALQPEEEPKRAPPPQQQEGPAVPISKQSMPAGKVAVGKGTVNSNRAQPAPAGPVKAVPASGKAVPAAKHPAPRASAAAPKAAETISSRGATGGLKAAAKRPAASTAVAAPVGVKGKLSKSAAPFVASGAVKKRVKQ